MLLIADRVWTLSIDSQTSIGVRRFLQTLRAKPSGSILLAFLDETCTGRAETDPAQLSPPLFACRKTSQAAVEVSARAVIAETIGDAYSSHLAAATVHSCTESQIWPETVSPSSNDSDTFSKLDTSIEAIQLFRQDCSDFETEALNFAQSNVAQNVAINLDSEDYEPASPANLPCDVFTDATLWPLFAENEWLAMGTGIQNAHLDCEARLIKRISIPLPVEEQGLEDLKIPTVPIAKAVDENLDETGHFLWLPQPKMDSSYSPKKQFDSGLAPLSFADLFQRRAKTRSGSRFRLRPLSGLTNLNIELRDRWWAQDSTWESRPFDAEELDATETSKDFFKSSTPSPAMFSFACTTFLDERATSGASTLMDDVLLHKAQKNPSIVDLPPEQQITEQRVAQPTDCLEKHSKVHSHLDYVNLIVTAETGPQTIDKKTVSSNTGHGSRLSPPIFDLGGEKMFDHIFNDIIDGTQVLPSSSLFSPKSISDDTSQISAPAVGSTSSIGGRKESQELSMLERKTISQPQELIPAPLDVRGSLFEQCSRKRKREISNQSGMQLMQRAKLDSMTIFLYSQGQLSGEDVSVTSGMRQVEELVFSGKVPHLETALREEPDAQLSCDKMESSHLTATRTEEMTWTRNFPAQRHHYIATLRGLQKQTVMRTLERHFNVGLVERANQDDECNAEAGMADLILDSVTNVILFKLTHLPAAMQGDDVQDRLVPSSARIPIDLDLRNMLQHSRYDRTLVILEAFASSDHHVVEETEPLRKALQKFKNFASLACGTGTISTVRIALAQSVAQAAAICRAFADELQEEARLLEAGMIARSSQVERGSVVSAGGKAHPDTVVTPYKTWVMREQWLYQVDDIECNALQRRGDLNSFASSLVLAARGSLSTFLSDDPDRRLSDFGLVLGEERISRLNERLSPSSSSRTDF